MSREDVDAIERAICPGEGACGGMYTANTMASAAEALGMSLPGSAAPPGHRPAPRRLRAPSGEAVVELLRKGITARADPDPGGVRERDRRRDGVRRLDQRRAAPARDRARGRGRPDPGRLQPRSAPRCRTWPTSSRSASYVMTDVDRGRRRAGGHEGAARRRAAARRLPDRHRPHDGREPRRHRAAGPRRQGAARDGQPDPPHRRHHDPARLAGARRARS